MDWQDCRQESRHTEAEIEREAGEMWLAGTMQAFARAPEHSAIWLAARAILPCLEGRLVELGWQRPRRPEDLAWPTEPPEV